ncbi:hypothetical protein AKJ51_00890 [candidate division MSBL1 archaeon SCGC-AAA382A20]|uniref:Uncharacterized protein n=1 Tax=candidate division MSBL1 archaeon SCGC-AAA382A20 TaxID=1698280 RepID=A0A133VMB0_9EURY|nr:hypothetical protein AKJ51_00890 [candidate division MSBL1 archaeon SCGC-AAA382A20]
MNYLHSPKAPKGLYSPIKPGEMGGEIISFSVLGPSLFTVTIGLWIVGMALAGLADLGSALKIVFVVGIALGIPFIWFLNMGDYYSATIVGVAGTFNFLQAGLGGFFEDYDAKTSSQVLTYVGIFLAVSGTVAIIRNISVYVGAWLWLAGVILWLITLAVYEIASRACAGGVIIISVINTILSYIIWLGYV